MKQFWSILKFEYGNYAKTKLFIVLTAVLVAVMGVVLFFPRFTAGNSEPGSADPGPADPGQKAVIALNAGPAGGAEETRAMLENAMPEYRFEITELSQEDLTQKVDAGEYASAILLESPTSYTYLVKNVSMYDTNQAIIGQVLTAKYQTDTMEKLGLTAADASSILNAQVTGAVVSTGINQMQNFFYTYILIFLLYMAIVLYGQFVAMSVAAEKSSRAMEMLITAAKPTNLMFGKVLGSGLAGLTQMVVLLGSAFVFYNINASYWGDNAIVQSIFNMPLPIMLYTVLFFVLGYFIYSFLYGALGSLASRSEDLNVSTMPITFLFIIAFLVVMTSMASGNVDSPLMVVCSYIPFTSPMAMFVRIAMSDVAPVEIIVSVVILVASTIGVGYLSAAIYKIGVLLYGKPPKLAELFRILRTQKNG